MDYELLTNGNINIGQKAPNFNAITTYGNRCLEDYKGKWSELFHNNHPLHIEIGMGKGQFIHMLASVNLDINYIGIEMYSSVLYRAL